MIRKAKVSDVKTIHQLLSAFSEKGAILPRSLSEIYDNMRDYSVYCSNDGETIVGACAIHVCWEDLAEIRSLAVDRKHAGKGAGRALVEHCLINTASGSGLKSMSLSGAAQRESRLLYQPASSVVPV